MRSLELVAFLYPGARRAPLNMIDHLGEHGGWTRQ
jgi:hypothetical protein